VNEYESLKTDLENMEELNKLLLDNQDIEFEKELIKNTFNLEEKIEKLEIETLLSGKYDSNNAIITLHPGAGGTESQDWVEMLYRMYLKWSNSNGYSLKELDYLEGDEARN
jgi:peptide chain release factor 2